jgi:hypothetical protein
VVSAAHLASVRRLLPSVIKRPIKAAVMWAARPSDRWQRARARFAYRLLSRLGGAWPNYQPAPWVGISSARRAEATESRWEAIGAVLDRFPPGSAMDLGSQVGYFTFRLAERGYLTLGVENGRRSLAAARLMRQASGIEGASFREMKLDGTTASQLPVVDVTLFLSLWHHLCRFDGFDAARVVLTEVLTRTRQVCFFETGQSDEQYMKWASALPDMKPDVREWIEGLLLECGARRVEHLGTFPTYYGPVGRHLFAAYTSPPPDRPSGPR